MPLRVDPLATARGQGPRYLVIGLLKPGVIGVAGDRATRNDRRATGTSISPRPIRGVSAGAVPYLETILGGEIYAMLMTMLGAGIGVLLIACVNVSNLLVARASLRRREVAVRMALGAARGRIIRQHLTEVLVLASAGAAIGILLSTAGMRWFISTLVGQPTTVLDHVRARSPDHAVRPGADRDLEPGRRRTARAPVGARRRRHGAQGRQPVVDERLVRPLQRRARRRRAGGVVRAADRRRPDDQERGAAAAPCRCRSLSRTC